MGRLAKPVYVFNRLLIPAGVTVRGRIISVHHAAWPRRAWTMAQGDFSPLKSARVGFQSLVLPDGQTLALHVSVSPGAPRMIRLIAGGKKKLRSRIQKLKDRLRQSVGQARRQIKTRLHQALAEIKGPGKWARLKSALAAALPYHSPVLPAGMEFTALLARPLTFGGEKVPLRELKFLGRGIPAGSLLHARLTTRLSSATSRLGSPVGAILTRPLFAPHHRLLLPEGTVLRGVVTRAVPARDFHRGGQLHFTFRKIVPAFAAPLPITAGVAGIETANAHLRLGAEGGVHASSSKTRFILPAFDVLLATSSFSNGDRGRLGSYHNGPDAMGGVVRGGFSLGLLGMVVGLAARSRPVSAGLAFYAAGRTLYTHVLARGRNVNFPLNTPLEIRFGRSLQGVRQLHMPAASPRRR